MSLLRIQQWSPVSKQTSVRPASAKFKLCELCSHGLVSHKTLLSCIFQCATGESEQPVESTVTATDVLRATLTGAQWLQGRRGSSTRRPTRWSDSSDDILRCQDNQYLDVLHQHDILLFLVSSGFERPNIPYITYQRGTPWQTNVNNTRGLWEM